MKELNNNHEILNHILKKIKNKNYKEAEKELIKIIKIEKNNFQAYYLLGIVLALIKNLKKL